MIDIEPIRERFSAVAPFLDERGRRLVAAAEAFAAGYGGITAVAMATGVAPSTIGRGLKELAQDEPSERIRRPGAGRKRTISKDPTLLPDLEALVERHRNAGLSSAPLATNVRNPGHFRRNMLTASFTARDPNQTLRSPKGLRSHCLVRDSGAQPECLERRSGSCATSPSSSTSWL